MRLLPFLLLPVCVSANLWATPNPKSERYQLRIKRATGKVVVDGKMNERDWQTAQPANNFWQQFPDDSSRARRNTEVRMTYDKHTIYIAVVAYQKQDYVV